MANIQPILKIALLIASPLFAQDSNWERLRALNADERVSVMTRDGKIFEGRFRSWSPDALEIVRQQRHEILRPDEVDRVRVERKGSRLKSTLIGAAIGFGAAFPFGFASARYIADRNNPPLGVRSEVGAGFGLFGGGIGAAIGALTGGRKNVTVYRAAARP